VVFPIEEADCYTAADKMGDGSGPLGSPDWLA
jgi:hypothetical protein